MKSIDAECPRATIPYADATILFLICLAVYLANGTIIASADTVPNTLLGFNFLQHHRIDFDNFRGTGYQSPSSYWLKNMPSGHLNSIYPIGPALISFPICVCFWVYLKLIHVQLDITSFAFEHYRQLFEHLAASTIASLSVVLFYLSSRLKFSQTTALTTSCVFAFATNMWVTCSQALWQHGSSNLMLLATFYSLLRACRATTKPKLRVCLMAAGLCCGLLPVIRPTNLIFLIAFVLYPLRRFRVEALFFLLGCLSLVPGLSYNNVYFGTLLGGYGNPMGPFGIALVYFQASCLGILFSPSRGLFVYSPVLIFSASGIWQLLKKLQSATDEEQLIMCLTVASLLHCSVYFFYYMWWGGHCYGPRFMTEALPMLVFLINWFIAEIARNKSIVNRLKSALFALLFTFSLGVQIVGAFGLGGLTWNPIPLNVDQFQWRLWRIHDSQIERHCRSLFHRLFDDKKRAVCYPGRMLGKVLSLSDENGNNLAIPLIAVPGEHKVLKMELENIGTVKWIGYESGVETEQTCVETTLVDKLTNAKVPAGVLYVASSPRPGQKSLASGEITFPGKCGEYLLLARLACKNMTISVPLMPPFVMNVQVLKKQT